MALIEELKSIEAELAARGMKHVYQIYDRHDQSKVGKPVKTRHAAMRKVDRLDNAYGAYRYYWKAEEVPA